MSFLFDRNKIAKYIFIAIASLIVIGSLVVSNNLVKNLSKEEEQKIRQWAEATRIVNTSDVDTDLTFVLQIISSNTTIPVLLCDEDDNVITSINIELPEEEEKQAEFLKKKVDSFRKKHEPIVVDNETFEQFVYYDDSYTLKQLQIYPYVQIGILTVFVLVSFWALLSTKRAEQNKVWVGLSKETAHQLGTPISSLMAWLEYMRMKNFDNSIITEMEKDTRRLQVITDRFSKIGSAPSTQTVNMQEVLAKSIEYLKTRISKKVEMTYDFEDEPLYASINEPLFDWVIENISKNAVDAMEGKGSLSYTLFHKGDTIYLDIEDTGKGIPKSRFKTVFKPGYTTKSRGWGLGLSLVKRIIEEYHHGKIYVQGSEPYLGTIFRIELKSTLPQETNDDKLK
ncbi:sensor histidine kinase [Dysgonomonas sp. 520]|uniref:sensor histidine kinase n=1 Tax=Dysgonomonas sp. 520 TaxID=2302931 RepID=UPI00351AAD65